MLSRLLLSALESECKDTIFLRYGKKCWPQDQHYHEMVAVPLFLLDKGDDPEEDDGADDGGDDAADDATPVDAKPAEDVAADETADDTNQEVDPEAEADPFHDTACQKASQSTDED